jgi:alpha-N-arabinofuranosidase
LRRERGCTFLDPNESVKIEANLAGISVRSAVGETLTAPKVDSVNTFEAPTAVAPKTVAARVQDNNVTLKLGPKSVTVISIEH